MQRTPRHSYWVSLTRSLNVTRFTQLSAVQYQTVYIAVQYNTPKVLFNSSMLDQPTLSSTVGLPSFDAVRCGAVRSVTVV